MFTYSAFADEISPDLSVQISELRKYNINHIEARGINGKNIANYTIAEAKEIKKILDDNSFKLSALGSPIGKIKIDDDFMPELDKFKNILELSKVFETKYIRMFSFYMDTKDAASHRDEVLLRWQKYVVAAKGYNVILLHENEKGIYGDTAERCLDIIKSLNCNFVKATFDPANFVQCKVDVLKAFDILEEYIEYLHIKDALWSTGEVVPAGMGDGSVREIITKLYKKNWSGFLSLEPHLGDFEGFADLEEEGTKLKGRSDAQKFSLAFNAVNNILNEVL